jgi:hypothetical protein
MAQKKRPSFGPASVGFLALHDRAFFERLVKDPRAAMKAKVAEGKLTLTEADMSQVAELIRKRNEARPDVNPLTKWDEYHRSGEWGNGDDPDWPRGWVAWW